MISYLVLTPENQSPSIINGTNVSNHTILKTYDKCGADFSEEEYQSSEVANKIDRRTVCCNYAMKLLWKNQKYRLSSIDQYTLYHLRLYRHMLHHHFDPIS